EAVDEGAVRLRLGGRDFGHQRRDQLVGAPQVVVLQRGLVEVREHLVVVDVVGDLRIERLRRLHERDVERARAGRLGRVRIVAAGGEQDGGGGGAALSGGAARAPT